jgi:energy-coupling factor transporter ATP-binding protein EcfA2
MAGSCNWALEMPDVQVFLSSETSQILKIGGAPGSGKTTLIAFLIGYIMRTTTNDVLYFFCKGTDERKCHPFQVLRTLASQILAKDESLYPWFETLHQQSGQETAESFASLHSSFQLALRNTSKPLIFIAVDALDECQEAKDLVFSMMTAAAETKRTIKILITVRNSPFNFLRTVAQFMGYTPGQTLFDREYLRSMEFIEPLSSQLLI